MNHTDLLLYVASFLVGLLTPTENLWALLKDNRP